MRGIAKEKFKSVDCMTSDYHGRFYVIKTFKGLEKLRMVNEAVGQRCTIVSLNS